MTSLELWLICILCYILIGIILSIAYYLKECNDIEKAILDDKDKSEWEKPLYYDNVSTLMDGIIIIFCWPFCLLYFLCRGIALSIDLMVDFLEKHGM